MATRQQRKTHKRQRRFRTPVETLRKIAEGAAQIHVGDVRVVVPTKGKPRSVNFKGAYDPARVTSTETGRRRPLRKALFALRWNGNAETAKITGVSEEKLQSAAAAARNLDLCLQALTNWDIYNNGYHVGNLSLQRRNEYIGQAVKAFEKAGYEVARRGSIFSAWDQRVDAQALLDEIIPAIKAEAKKVTDDLTPPARDTRGLMTRLREDVPKGLKT